MSGELCDPGLRGFEGWGYPGAGGGAEKSVGERMKGFWNFCQEELFKGWEKS